MIILSPSLTLIVVEDSLLLTRGILLSGPMNSKIVETSGSTFTVIKPSVLTVGLIFNLIPA
jgi:hypothetical protein